MGKKYYKHKIEKLLVVDDVVTIHYLQPEKNFSFGPEEHDFWELVYADEESVVVTAGDKKFILSEGEMLFHKPNERHSLAADGKKAPNVFIISFVCKSRAMRFFENKKIKLNKKFLKFVYFIAEEGKKTFNLPYFNPSLTKMELMPHPALGGEQLIKNYLEILLISVMRSETEKENSDAVFLQKEEDGRVSKQIIEFLKENVNEKLGIAEVCEKVNYNKSYVFREFKADTGSTIMAYFTRLKIEKAKQMLREGNYNVTQIARILSFDTPNYFTKTFKKITGFSPLQYKKIYLSSPS